MRSQYLVAIQRMLEEVIDNYNLLEDALESHNLKAAALSPAAIAALLCFAVG
jgi:hypothetical protein